MQHVMVLLSGLLRSMFVYSITVSALLIIMYPVKPAAPTILCLFHAAPPMVPCHAASGTGGPGELREVFLLHLQDTTSTAAAQQAVQQWQVDQPEWLQQFMEPPGVITKPFCMVSSSSQQQEGEEWYSGEAAVSTYHMHAWPVKDIGVPYLLRRQREALAVLLQQADERPLCWLQQQLLQIAPELEAAANAHRRRHSGSNAEALAVTARHASSSVAAAAVPGTEPHAYGVEPWMPALLHVRGNIQQQQQQQHTIHQECFIPCHPLSGAEAAEAVSSAVAVVCAYVELRDDRPVSAEEAAAVLQSVAVLEGVVEACLGSSLVWQFKVGLFVEAKGGGY